MKRVLITIDGLFYAFRKNTKKQNFKIDQDRQRQPAITRRFWNLAQVSMRLSRRSKVVIIYLQDVEA